VKKEKALFELKTRLLLAFFLVLLGFAPHASAADNVSGRASERVVREGIAAEFSYEPAGKRDGGEGGVTAIDPATLKIEFRDFVHLSLRVEGK